MSMPMRHPARDQWCRMCGEITMFYNQGGCSICLKAIQNARRAGPKAYAAYKAQRLVRRAELQAIAADKLAQHLALPEVCAAKQEYMRTKRADPEWAAKEHAQQVQSAAEHPEWAARKLDRYAPIRLANAIAQAVTQAWRIEFADEIRELVNTRTLAYQRQARIDDPDKVRARERAKRAANPMVYKAIKHNREARKRGAPGICTAEQEQARWDMFGGCCWMCGAPADTTDHVKPLIAHGSNWPANLRPACFSCNSAKQGKWPFPTYTNMFYPRARVAV